VEELRLRKQTKPVKTVENQVTLRKNVYSYIKVAQERLKRYMQSDYLQVLRLVAVTNGLLTLERVYTCAVQKIFSLHSISLHVYKR